MISKLIINGKILENGELVEKNILIENHKIRELIDDQVTVDEIIDVKGKIILPGLIDCHVHMREPGFTEKEDFFTGSKAAAIGGITTFLDMPNNKPPIVTVEALEQKRKLAKKSIVNYGFHFGSTPDNLSEIEKAEKIASVKVYMNATTGDLLVDRDENLTSLFKAANRISVHAEGPAVEKAIDIFKSIDNKKKKLYLCHVATAEEMETIKKNKKANIHVEVIPHHLFLTSEDAKDGFTKMKPSLKSKTDQDALWEGIKSGIVSTIATDHAPHTILEKQSENPPYGVPGEETLLPLLLNAVNEGKLSLAKVVELTAENPAKIFCLKDKGKIEEGYDADLVVVDMELEKEVRNEDLKTKCKWSSFNGRKLKGWPIMTIISGKLINNNGILTDTHKGREVVYYERKSSPSIV
ncbi:MAG: amidohydrolase family protein [Candidatus Woesearchaeota archaeon]|jgi:dihydroorotase|nr:amidohydrolase family protein [Candidatus Woesearchaeota archaeon]MDP7180074.1 amidohydrolase family protein [Candidatus Woesearchaeota archaeon]